MKFLIGSDIHGSLYYAKLFLKEASSFDRILLLGDFYYNGARNDPPKDYAPKEVVSLLNSYKDKIIAVKGNCESEVDQMVSLFPISERATLFAFGRTMTMVHGHHESMEDVPYSFGDVFLQGHTHVSVLKERDGKLFLNPGSVSLPKDGRHSYMTMDERGVALIDLMTGEVVSSYPWKR